MSTKASKNGLHTEYFENGQKKIEKNYRDGRLHGNWIEWYEKFKYSRIKELYQEPSMSEKEAYLFHTPMALSYPKQLLRLLRGDF